MGDRVMRIIQTCINPSVSRPCEHMIIHPSEGIKYTWYFCDCFEVVNGKIIRGCEKHDK